MNLAGTQTKLDGTNKNRIVRTDDPRGMTTPFSDVRYVRVMSAIPRQPDDPSHSISLTTFSMYSKSSLPYGDVENLTKSLSVWTSALEKEQKQSVISLTCCSL